MHLHTSENMKQHEYRVIVDLLLNMYLNVYLLNVLTERLSSECVNGLKHSLTYRLAQLDSV